MSLKFRMESSFNINFVFYYLKTDFFLFFISRYYEILDPIIISISLTGLKKVLKLCDIFWLDVWQRIGWPTFWSEQCIRQLLQARKCINTRKNSKMKICKSIILFILYSILWHRDLGNLSLPHSLSWTIPPTSICGNIYIYIYIGFLFLNESPERSIISEKEQLEFIQSQINKIRKWRKTDSHN